MKLLRIGMIGGALVLQCVTSWAIYGVRISDLGHTPLPTNPIRIWGKVTSELPLKLSDGRAEISVNGWAASVGVFLILNGNWDGSSFTVISADDDLTTEMVYIPAGSFQMGNNGSEPYSYSNELPQHSVYLSGYWIGKYEVTRGEYRAFVEAAGYSNSAYWSSAGWSWKVSNGRTQPYYWDAVQYWGTHTFAQADSHPVVGVSYYECEAFCNWAGGHLPTEAQWEKAARWTGSHPNVYPWGDVWDWEVCNNLYDHDSAGGGYSKFQTAPMGSYLSGACPYGCQDMAGNVWEWCKDWYQDNYYSSSPANDPPGPSSGSHRALRGGSWGDLGNATRCAFRYNGYYPYDCDNGGGFRLAR